MMIWSQQMTPVMTSLLAIYNCICFCIQITPGMRAVLIEWITGMHHQLQLYRETLFLTVNIIDRFLSITPISRDCFQLLGITAVLIASKQVGAILKPRGLDYG